MNTITKECEIKNYKELKTFKGSEFKGTICIIHLLKWILIMMFQC